jgi:hypothetical protein
MKPRADPHFVRGAALIGPIVFRCLCAVPRASFAYREQSRGQLVSSWTATCAVSSSGNVTAQSPYRVTRMANSFRPDHSAIVIVHRTQGVLVDCFSDSLPPGPLLRIHRRHFLDSAVGSNGVSNDVLVIVAGTKEILDNSNLRSARRILEDEAKRSGKLWTRSGVRIRHDERT